MSDVGHHGGCGANGVAIGVQLGVTPAYPSEDEEGENACRGYGEEAEDDDDGDCPVGEAGTTGVVLNVSAGGLCCGSAGGSCGDGCGDGRK